MSTSVAWYSLRIAYQLSTNIHQPTAAKGWVPELVLFAVFMMVSWEERSFYLHLLIKMYWRFHREIPTNQTGNSLQPPRPLPWNRISVAVWHGQINSSSIVVQNTSHPKTNLHTSFCPQLLRCLQKQMSWDYTHHSSQGRPLFGCTDIILHSTVSNGKGENMSQRFLFSPNAVKLFRSLLKYEARYKQKKNI